MKVIIAGDRDTDRMDLVLRALVESGFKPTTIVSGCARGVDTVGEQIALRLDIPIERYPAQWDRYGRAAGPIRNAEMANAADALVALVVPGSKGTRDMIKQARERGLKVHVMALPGSNMAPGEVTQ